MKKAVALMAAMSMFTGVIPVNAANLTERQVSAVSESTIGGRSYSSTYTEITTLSGTTGNDEWRNGLVTGGGENGVIDSAAPATDVMIFQNIKFGYPTNAVRVTPNTSSVREQTKQDMLSYNGTYLSSVGAQAASDAMVKAAGDWARDMNMISGNWNLCDTYSFHPGHQIRLQMDGASNGQEAAYERYTDYNTAEIGANWTDKDGGSWERKTFSSREDNVNITSLRSTNGAKINLTLTVDDIARMSNEGGVQSVLADLRYRKIVDTENGDYIGISAHYPYYHNSTLNNAGFGGITRIVIKGGEKTYVFGSETADSYANPNGGATDTQMNLGIDKRPAIKITDADELYLITKTELGKNIGTLGDFETNDENPEYINKLISDTAEVAMKYGGNDFDYDKALAPSAAKHGEIMNRLTYSVCTSAEDIAMRSYTNEELIAAQQASKNRLLPAMLERLWYNGRFAAVCCSGVQAPRLGGMWTGAWGVEWSGDYTTDANINLQIAGANLGSIQEETEGFINLMVKNVTDWQLNAKQFYGIDNALMAPSRTDGHSAVMTHFQSWPGEMWIGGASWLIYPMYEYYQCFGNQNIPLTDDIRAELEFTGNKYAGYTETLDKNGTQGAYHDFSIKDSAGNTVVYNLRNTLDLSNERAEEILAQGYLDLERDILYPLVTKTANFWQGYVDPRYYVVDGVAKYDANHTAMGEGESWFIAPSFSAENGAGFPDGGWKEYTANATMDSAASRSIMEMAEELEEKLNFDGAEERIAAYKEFTSHIPPYLYEESGELKEWTLKDYKETYGHRHGSQLYGLWPLHEAENDDELFAGAKKLIETKNSVPTGDGSTGHGWLHRGLTMARLKDGGGVRENILPLVTNRMIYDSMMMSHNIDRTRAYCTDTVITIPAIELESLVYSADDTLELLPAVIPDVKVGGHLGGSEGVSLRSGGKLESLDWSGETVAARITGSEGVKLKLTPMFDTLKVNGYDVTSQIKIDETGDRYYLIDTDDEISVEFSLTQIKKITVSTANSTIHNGEKLQFTAKCEPEGTSGLTWEVENLTGKAEIDDDGVLYAKAKGKVKVRAKALSGGAVSDWMGIEILGGLDELNKFTSDDYTVFGRTKGQWETNDPPANAFDGSVGTAYDGQNGGYCGIELNTPGKITAFRYMPRSGNEYRMPGTQFQVSEDGINYTTVYTVTDTGSYGSYAVVYADELPEPERSLLVNNEYKFFRFYSGFYSEEEHYSNIAEIEVYGELSQQNKDVILNPKVEGFAEKAGVSTAPAFSWGYAAGDEAKYQTAYQIVIKDISGKEVYDSGKVNSDKTQGITIGKTLEPGTKYTWDLRTWLDNGEENERLANTFVTGLEDWQGKWISGGAASFYARKDFDVNKEIAGAYAYVCGLGQFKLFLNGEKVGNHELDPGWTDYDRSVQYVTFDITDMVKNGENAVGVSVGNGWYSPQKDNYFYVNPELVFADELALICDIVLEYADGSREVIATDKNWRVHDSATTVANAYGSEFFDARLYPDGWNNIGFNDSGWKNAALIDGPKGKLVPQSQPPVTVKKVYEPVSVNGNIFDMGQNMSGQFEIYVSGPAGATVTITAAEKLESNGDIDAAVRTASKYTLKGDGIEVWKPDFTYMGGRWVRIDGAETGDVPVNGKVIVHDVKAYYLTNSADEVGSFTTTDERYDKVLKLVLSAMESNLQSVHTDCPIWERLGWLETSQLMAPSIIYNKDARELLRKIARDAAEAQYENGFIPNVAPAYPKNAFGGAYWDSPAWGSAAVIVPWLLYEYYGDTYSLEENYEAMKKYAEYLKSKEDANGMVMQGLGDWGIAPPNGTRSEANMETGLYYWDLRILRDTAEMFGYSGDATYFASEVERVRNNYNDLLLVKNEDNGLYVYRDLSRANINDYDPNHYVSYGNYVQGNQAIALFLDDIIPDYAKDDIIESFRITLQNGNITTGEISQRFILQMATKYGLTDVIHNKVTSRRLGGYYRFVLNGETTLPEYWEDAARSRNHDMLGHIMEWFYNGVGGISPETPGFKTVRVAPRPPQVLEGANVKYESVKGKIVSSWEHTLGNYRLHVELPANTNGVISIPTFGMTEMTLTSGGDVLYSDGEGKSHGDITYVSDEDGLTFEVKNGSFDFVLTGNEPLPAASGEPIEFTPSVSSDIANWGWSVAASVDGNRDSVSNAMGWSSDTTADRNHDEWYMLDFGKTVTVNRLDLYPRNDAGNVGKGFPIDFRIEASDGGGVWTTLVEITDYTVPTSNGVKSFSFANTECQYLRVYATKLHAVDGREYRMQFAEVEAYNDSSLYNGPLTVTELRDVDSLITGKVYCLEPGNYTVYCAGYDRNGLLLNVEKRNYSFDSAGVADFSAVTAQEAQRVSIFGWKDGMVPAMERLDAATPIENSLTASIGQNQSAFHSLRARTEAGEYSFTLVDRGSHDSGIMLGSSASLNSESGNYFADGSVVLLFSDGILYTRDADSKTEVAKYTVGREVQIKILADIISNTYSLYVDGVLTAENVGFRTPAFTIDTLAFVENGGGTAFEIKDFIAK